MGFTIEMIELTKFKLGTVPMVNMTEQGLMFSINLFFDHLTKNITINIIYYYYYIITIIIRKVQEIIWDWI